MKALERRQWRHSGAFFVNCELISYFVLIFNVEKANVCWVDIEKANTFKDAIRYIKHHVLVFKCEQNLKI